MQTTNISPDIIMRLFSEAFMNGNLTILEEPNGFAMKLRQSGMLYNISKTPRLHASESIPEIVAELMKIGDMVRAEKANQTVEVHRKSEFNTPKMELTPEQRRASFKVVQ